MQLGISEMHTDAHLTNNITEQMLKGTIEYECCYIESIFTNSSPEFCKTERHKNCRSLISEIRATPMDPLISESIVVMGVLRDDGLCPNIVDFLLHLRPQFFVQLILPFFFSFFYVFFPIHLAPAHNSPISLPFSLLLWCESHACGMKGWP